jgi:hypothetical protein
MAKEQIPMQEPISYEIGLKLRDLEESERLMKERVIMIGNNFIESQDKNRSEIIELKKIIYELQSDTKRLKEIIQSLSEEIEKSARREEIAILSRQFKMFEPLHYARIEDIDKIVEEKINKHNNSKNKEELIKDDKKHEFWRGKV